MKFKAIIWYLIILLYGLNSVLYSNFNYAIFFLIHLILLFIIFDKFVQIQKFVENKEHENYYFTTKEKEVLNDSILEHIRLLTLAGMKEQDKQKKTKYLLTRNIMLDIQKKLNPKSEQKKEEKN